MKFYIYAPSYNENSGGCIALHKLAHILNEETEHQAYLVPRVLEKHEFHSLYELLRLFNKRYKFARDKARYKTNPEFNTPVISSISDIEWSSSICVYPELTFGNPLKATNVVRWFLHQPGHFRKEVCFATGELYFKYSSGIKDFELYNSKLSTKELKVNHFPLEIYNRENESAERSGTCYMVRKGKHKPFIHPEGSVCIDGLSHREIAREFKRAEQFISYDDYTAYSKFAVLCGCKSVVVPDENTSIDEWYSDEKDRYGIAYGFSDEQITWANATQDRVLETIEQRQRESVDRVLDFVEECQSYFDI
ncbi:WavQ [Vibrio sp. WXL210]|uniref:WavQ n=1 Tax=Vibrio sp. WXL210 TaxID=3450709 RepID=UPI003EC7B7D3